GASNGGYGAFRMTGGSFTQSRFMFGGTSATTAAGGIGVGLVAGGTVNSNGYLILSRAGNSIGQLVVTGGLVDHTSASQNIYIGLAGTAAARAELTVAGGMIDNAGRSVSFSGGSFNVTAGAIGTLNLNAGTLLTNSIVQGSTASTSAVNFNGGTFQ